MAVTGQRSHCGGGGFVPTKIVAFEVSLGFPAVERLVPVETDSGTSARGSKSLFKSSTSVLSVPETWIPTIKPPIGSTDAMRFSTVKLARPVGKQFNALMIWLASTPASVSREYDTTVTRRYRNFVQVPVRANCWTRVRLLGAICCSSLRRSIRSRSAAVVASAAFFVAFTTSAFAVSSSILNAKFPASASTARSSACAVWFCVSEMRISSKFCKMASARDASSSNKPSPSLHYS
jgi:hypothetical protein